MKDIINYLQKSDTWTIQLTIAINFVSSKHIDEEHVMYFKSDNIEVIAYDQVDEGIRDLFESLLYEYKIELETTVRGSNFIFDIVYLLQYIYHKM